MYVTLYSQFKFKFKSTEMKGEKETKEVIPFKIVS